MAIATTLAAAAGSLGMLLAATEAPAAASGSRDALYAAAGGVVVALISGVTAILVSKNRPAPEPPIVRYIDPPSTHALPAEMSDLLAIESRRVDELRQEVAGLRAEVDLWQERAYLAGWRP